MEIATLTDLMKDTHAIEAAHCHNHQLPLKGGRSLDSQLTILKNIITAATAQLDNTPSEGPSKEALDAMTARERAQAAESTIRGANGLPGLESQDE